MKNLMTNMLDNIVNQFGFENLHDFLTSMVHSKLFYLTIPASAVIFGMIEKWFGVSSAIFGAFVVMAVMELVSGIWGAIAQKKRLKSRKFGRFGLKILVWFSLIYVAHAFAQSYKEMEGFQANIIYQIFSWFHGVLMVYVSFEYIISILENLGKITGKTNSRLIRFLNTRLDKVLGEDPDIKNVEVNAVNAVDANAVDLNLRDKIKEVEDDPQ